MKSFRRHLGALATTWLLFQAASLSALLPGVCCLQHSEDAATDPEDCHKVSPSSEACPMMSADGQPCPEHAAQTPSGERCVMRGTCNAPMAALASLFSLPAVMTAQTAVPYDAATSAVAISAIPALVVSLAFDTPPPRL